MLFQSTSPVWRTTFSQVTRKTLHFISIHVPRVEDDRLLRQADTIATNFNPRPPCGGRRQAPLLQTGKFSISIHVPRVEDDPSPSVLRGSRQNFNPRPPCGGRPTIVITASTAADFNPRPPCGGRPIFTTDWLDVGKFQSTSPVWRTTGAYRTL